MLEHFEFEGNKVRFVGTPEIPEWIAKDVCNCLGLTDTSKAVETLEETDKGTKIIRTPSGDQDMLTVYESGLYALIFKSRKPVAKRFKRWVFEQVLPSIRKTGSYSVNQPKQLSSRDAIDYIEATVKLEQLKDSILTRLLKDELIDELSLKRNQKALPCSEQKRITIVKVRAKELGYSTKQIGDGVALGRFVANKVNCQFKEAVGRYTVKHYEVNNELDTAIHAFFLTRNL